jgi:hypothetical protein
MIKILIKTLLPFLRLMLQTLMQERRQHLEVLLLSHRWLQCGR